MKNSFAIEHQGKYKNFNYIVIARKIGFRCGYVRLPKNNKFYGKHYGDIDLLDVHGGLTFSGKLTGLAGFWIGFDCAHFGDGYDLSLVKDETVKECLLDLNKSCDAV